MRLLDVFLIHCLISESESVSQSEYDEMNKNYMTAIHSGSDLDLSLNELQSYSFCSFHHIQTGLLIPTQKLDNE